MNDVHGDKSDTGETIAPVLLDDVCAALEDRIAGLATNPGLLVGARHAALLALAAARGELHAAPAQRETRPNDPNESEEPALGTITAAARNIELVAVALSSVADAPPGTRQPETPGADEPSAAPDPTAVGMSPTDASPAVRSPYATADPTDQPPRRRDKFEFGAGPQQFSFKRSRPELGEDPGVS